MDIKDQFAIGMPVSGSLPFHTVQSLLGIQSATSITPIFVYGDTANRAYSRLASQFLRHSKAEALLMIDSDIEFRPVDVMGITGACRKGYDIISGVVSVKGGDCRPVFAPLEPQTITIPGNKIIECDVTGNAFRAVHRKVYEELAKHLPEITEPGQDPFYPFYTEKVIEENGVSRWLTEDYSFCRTAKEHGFSNYIHTGIVVAHHGDFPYTVFTMRGCPVEIEFGKKLKEG